MPLCDKMESFHVLEKKFFLIINCLVFDQLVRLGGVIEDMYAIQFNQRCLVIYVHYRSATSCFRLQSNQISPIPQISHELHIADRILIARHQWCLFYITI